ncbi:MAG: hypothetical protein LBG13_01435 [Holosporales bacterium]|nr:hypothetical protein [Holosporales bacterium]
MIFEYPGVNGLPSNTFLPDRSFGGQYDGESGEPYDGGGDEREREVPAPRFSYKFSDNTDDTDPRLPN